MRTSFLKFQALRWTWTSPCSDVKSLYDLCGCAYRAWLGFCQRTNEAPPSNNKQQMQKFLINPSGPWKLEAEQLPCWQTLRSQAAMLLHMAASFYRATKLYKETRRKQKSDPCGPLQRMGKVFCAVGFCHFCNGKQWKLRKGGDLSSNKVLS